MFFEENHLKVIHLALDKFQKQQLFKNILVSKLLATGVMLFLRMNMHPFPE